MAVNNNNNNANIVGEAEELNNNNNNNADNKEEVDPDFDYHPGDSTTCIFVQNPTTGFNFTIGWRHPPHYRPFVPPSTTIFSSSRGLLLCHEHSPSTSISTYYVGNPFQETPYNTLHPLQPHHSDTHTVLAVSPSGTFLIVCLLPNPTQEGDIYYTIEAYWSHRVHWFTLSNSTHLDFGTDRVVMPNSSGISCRRFVYWLTWLASSRSSVMLVRVDVKSTMVDPVKYPLMTYLRMPPCIRKRNDNGEVRMKLGRWGRRMGLAVVNERMTRVEMYVLKEKIESVNEKDTMMEGWFQYPGCLKVDVDPTVEEGVVEVVEPNRIKCREMPEPMRFESNKMEVLVSVGGGRRVVLWESRRRNPLRTRVTVVGTSEVPVLGSEIPAGGQRFLADSGVPHVTTSMLPKIVTPEDE